MFTGIIETTGQVREIKSLGTNKTFWISSPLSHEFTIDQSIAHNGVCLTVEEVNEGSHRVTAIAETLQKTTMDQWQPGQLVNIERCLSVNARLDGHFVQGHVDGIGECISKKDLSGSWEFRFRFPAAFAPLVIEKGSVSLNGISLTIFNIGRNEFSVAIIPYTYHNTNIRQIETGSPVNLEFDVIGKYVNRIEMLKTQA